MSGHKPSLPSSSSSHLPASLQLLHQKQQEHAALQALHEASAELVARAERMAGMSGTMADGGETIGKVLQNWSYIFNLLEQVGAANPNLNTGGGAALTGNQSSDTNANTQNEQQDEPLPMMVRMPYLGEDQQPQE